MLAALIAGCGGATPEVRSSEAAPPDDGCGPSATRLGAECWSAAGTRWAIAAEGPGGTYEFEVELLAAGRVRATDHRGASPATDEWFQDGPLLRIFLADRFVEYRATIENGTVIVGEAINVRGQRWAWRGSRLFGEHPCRDDVARVGESCFTVVGTLWQLGDGAPIELLANGAVARGTGEPAEGDRWEQEGGAVRFSIGGRRYEGELDGTGTLRGTSDGASFTATRLESIPPLARR